MAQDSVKVSLEIATQAAEIALKNLKKTTEETNSSFNIFKGSFAAGIALDALKGSFGAISGFISSVVEESSKAQQSIQNMNVALQNAGLYSASTSQHFQDLADSIEITTSFAGDAVESSVTLLASLTKLDKDGITSATKAAVDLAATLNIDLGSATDMIAKAVNGNVTAFGKLGIEIQKGRTDSENLANTLQALSSQQGAAVKQADTFAGATAKLANQQGKLLESLGNMITMNPIVIGGINTLTEAFIGLSSFIQKNQQDITLMIQSLAASIAIVTAAGAAWIAYTASIGATTIALTTLRTVAAATWAVLTGPIGLAVAAVSALGVAIYKLVQNWDYYKAAALDALSVSYDLYSKYIGLFSSERANYIKAEAQAFREKADAIRAAAQAESEAKNQPQENQSTGEDVAAAALKREQELQQLKEYYAEKTAAKREHDQALILSESDLNLQMQELKAQHEAAMFEISGVYDDQALSKQLETDQAMLLARQQFERDQLQATIDAQKAKALLIQNDQQREKALRDAGYKGELAQVQLKNKQQIEQIKLQNKTEEQLEKQKINNKRETWGMLLSLQNSSNKELATAGKAFALYDIAVNTPVAVGKALSAYPPPFNFAAAALVGAAMASQAAQVTGLSFATGGIVPGTSYSGDKVTANVNSREMVLNMGQQKRLFDIANGGGDSNNTTNQLLIELISAVKSSGSIQIDGREIVAVVRDGLQAGRTI